MTEYNNMEIWSQIEETPTKYTTAGVKGLTSISGQYMLKKATELFGPVGIGWGYNILEERYDKAGPIFDKKTQEKICDALNHTIKIEFWYIHDGKKATLVNYGHTTYLTQSGPANAKSFNCDEEAPKKSLTDAIKKCLSMLGMCADVFLGYFDDREYIASQKLKERQEEAESQEEEIKKQKAEFFNWVEKELKAYELIPNVGSLKVVYEGHSKKVTNHCNQLGIKIEPIAKRFSLALKKAKERINQ